MIKPVDIGFLFTKETNIVLGNLHFGWIPLVINFKNRPGRKAQLPLRFILLFSRVSGTISKTHKTIDMCKNHSGIFRIFKIARFFFVSEKMVKFGLSSDGSSM